MSENHLTFLLIQK